MNPNPTLENASMNLFRSPRTARLSVAAMLAMAALLAGCASDVKLDKPGDVPVETRNTAPTPGADANAKAANQSSVASVDLSKSEAAQMMANLPKLIYFDFDSFVVKDEFRPLVEAHARYLQQNRNARMTIQGNTDERGSREYNIALGQKRADAVKRMMVLLGATDTQIETTSFGEERPKNPGHDESAWAENRRDDIVYAGE
jgi:peptidoglycan-associated lipoprotein